MLLCWRGGCAELEPISKLPMGLRRERPDTRSRYAAEFRGVT